MSETISNEVIKKTQSTLGKYVKKPPLSEKLLTKPPFRFLHDVIMAVVRSTGFLKGLYSAEEQNSENVKDRENKIAFLQKTIDVVKLVTGITLTVRPSKIISGHEPEKTNELLQAIGYAIDNNLSSIDAIHQIKIKAAKKEGNITDRKSKAGSPPKVQPAKPSQPRASSKSVARSDASKTKPVTEVRSDRSINKKKPEAKSREERKREEPRKKEEPRKREESRKREEPRKNEESRKKEEPRKLEETRKHEDQRKLEELPKREQTRDRVQKEENDHKERRGSKTDTTPNESGNANQGSTRKESAAPKLDRQKTEVIESPKVATPANKPVELTDNENSESISEKPKSRKSSVDKQPSPVHRQRSRADSIKTSVAEKKQEDNTGDTANKSSTPMIELTPTVLRHNSSSELRLDGDKMRLNLKSSDGPVSKEEKSGDLDVTSKHKEEVVIEQIVKDDEKGSKEKSDALKAVRPPSTRPRTSLRPPSVRPVSARPGAPRIRDRHGDVHIDPEETATLGKVNVTLEVFDGNAINPTDDVDDAEDLVVIETRDLKQNDVTQKKEMENIEEEDNTKGRLVGQILSTQRALGDAPKPQVKVEREISSVASSDSTALDALRKSVQDLSGAALPLGRLLDFLQEDADAMRRELRHWREVCAQTSEALKRDSGLTEEVIRPLKQQLQDLESQIADQREMINSSRANVLRQEERISKLLSEC